MTMSNSRFNAVGFMNKVSEFYGQLDAKWSDHCTKLEGKYGHPIRCHRGCSWCCHLMVTATLPEALAAFLQARCNRWEAPGTVFEQFTRVKKGLTIYQWTDQPPEESACPFLKDHECLAYDFRPVACRTHSVFSEPADCDTATQKSTLAADPHGGIEAGLGFMAEVSKKLGLRSSGFGPWPVTLLMAMLYDARGPVATNEALAALGMGSDQECAVRWLHMDPKLQEPPPLSTTEFNEALNGARNGIV